MNAEQVIVSAGAAYTFCLLLEGCPPAVAVYLAACRLVTMILAIAWRAP